jgi:hypothetical protein
MQPIGPWEEFAHVLLKSNGFARADRGRGRRLRARWRSRTATRGIPYGSATTIVSCW